MQIGSEYVLLLYPNPITKGGIEPPSSGAVSPDALPLSYIVMDSGSHLLSHIVSNAVPSAATVLTVVFGMGTGVPP